jgi:hypothetical protein
LAWVSTVPGASNALDLVGAFENSFGEEEAGCQLEVVTGSPHGNRDGFVAYADFEGFFDGEKILQGA